MLIYEKDNKLNINFENSSSLPLAEQEPDIVIGKDEIKLGETEITSDNVLPTATIEDAGKVVGVDENGSYALTEAGGGPLNVRFEITDSEITCDKTFAEILSAIEEGLDVSVSLISNDYDGGGTKYSFYNGTISVGDNKYSNWSKLTFMFFGAEATSPVPSQDGRYIIQSRMIVLNSDNTIGYQAKQLQL